jgi:hypothetical protein
MAKDDKTYSYAGYEKYKLWKDDKQQDKKEELKEDIKKIVSSQKEEIKDKKKNPVITSTAGEFKEEEKKQQTNWIEWGTKEEFSPQKEEEIKEVKKDGYKKSEVKKLDNCPTWDLWLNQHPKFGEWISPSNYHNYFDEHKKLVDQYKDSYKSPSNSTHDIIKEKEDEIDYLWIKLRSSEKQKTSLQIDIHTWQTEYTKAFQEKSKLEKENKMLKEKLFLIERDPEAYKRRKEVDPFDEEDWDETDKM